MASVSLSELWIHDGDDLSDFVQTFGFASEDETDAVAGEVRTYANGRRRIVRRAGTATSLSVTFPSTDRTTIDWLRAHKGNTLMLRDPYGRKVWGTFFSLSVPEKGSAQLPDASFTFESTSASEEV